MEINLVLHQPGDNEHKHIQLGSNNSPTVRAIYNHCEASVRAVHMKNFIQYTTAEVKTLNALLMAHDIGKINYI